MISAEQSLSCKDISKVMSLFDEGLDILMRKDPDFERSSKVSQAVATKKCIL